jgi:hypothetical protein
MTNVPPKKIDEPIMQERKQTKRERPGFFDHARAIAAGEDWLLDCLKCIESLMSVGVSPTQAAAVWISHNSRSEPISIYFSEQIAPKEPEH